MFSASVRGLGRMMISRSSGLAFGNTAAADRWGEIE
jgi:hypothetical protein